ncbi:Fumarylacetoacetase [Galdieria sulphuraria]|nr:Fumarylacetoacetase [Galdieria sulphuraria]
MQTSTTPIVYVPEDSDFTIYNLPYGVFETSSLDKRLGVAIGEYVLDLREAATQGFLSSLSSEYFQGTDFNAIMGLDRRAWKALRSDIQDVVYGKTSESIKSHHSLLSKLFIPMHQVSMHLPAKIGDYTDFYSSKEHATNVGTMFRGADNALNPNWVHLPVGYHGRSSSIIISGQDIRRPCGQLKGNQEPSPHYGPTQTLDFELEMAFFVGQGNSLFESIPAKTARDYIFGLVLMNDWSARDIQRWEYVPLGPFGAKNFATSISPWIVPLEALEPFRVPAPTQEPQVLEYLERGPDPTTFDIHLTVSIQSSSMRKPQLICESNFRYLYWTMEQQLAHHTVTGCNLRPGDLLASGTISGKSEKSFGSMLELSWGGSKPLKLEETQEQRVYLQDGDQVMMHGYCQKENIRIGFGSCHGKILPAKPLT